VPTPNANVPKVGQLDALAGTVQQAVAAGDVTMEEAFVVDISHRTR